MMVDLQGVGGILTDPQIHCLNPKKFGSGNMGYYGMMKFFMTHYCNEYCNKLHLVHPRKKMNIDVEKYDFFVDKYVSPDDPYETVFKVCDLCRKHFETTSGTVYEKKKACQEMYCESCDVQRKNTIKGGKCIDCQAAFKSSEYWFRMKRTDFPIRCSACRLANRNRMRKENENSAN